jgi:hypothetical protein
MITNKWENLKSKDNTLTHKIEPLDKEAVGAQEVFGRT